MCSSDLPAFKWAEDAKISRYQHNAVRKDQLRQLATVNVEALSGRSRKVVDMFKRRVDIRCLQEVRYRAKEPKYIEVGKSTSFSGADQRRAEMEY